MFGFPKRGKARDGAATADADCGGILGRDDLVAQANALMDRIGQESGKARAALLDERGDLLMRAGELDGAIEAFEKSLECFPHMGKAYQGLTRLYSKKRAAAAKAGDDAAIKEWLEKLQTLMQSSKDMLRGK